MKLDIAVKKKKKKKKKKKRQREVSKGQPRCHYLSSSDTLSTAIANSAFDTMASQMNEMTL